MLSLCVYNTSKYVSYQEIGKLITEKSFYSILSFIGLTPVLFPVLNCNISKDEEVNVV